MNPVPRIRSWWKALAHRDRTSADASAELQFHIDARADELIRRGATPEQAARQARIEVGQPATQGEKHREAIGLRPFDSLTGDVRYGLRSLLKNPGFSAVAILSLALGIGATTSMFSLIYAVLLHPVPYADWQRLAYPIYLNDDQPGSPERWFSLTWSQYQLLLKANSIDSVEGSNDVSSEITGGDIPEDITLAYETENIGDFLRVPALLGRNIQLSDAETVGQRAPIVLNYGFWLRHYNGDRDILGKTLEIDHKPYIIVGVMPKDYTWDPDVYVPASLLPVRDRNLLPVMKLKPGVSLAQADAEIGAILHQFARQSPQQFPIHFRLHLESVTGRVIQGGGSALTLLLVAVVMLLLIGCANCSILLLARSMARQGEFAVRTALGAGRYRIIRQLLVEAIVLAIAGSLLGIGLAYWMAKLIFGLFPDVFMHESIIRINPPILAFSIALAVICGLIFGLVPSLRMSRPDVSQVIQSTGRKVAGRAGQRRSLNTLIAAQIALTTVMMGAAGAAIGGFMHMRDQNLGYDPAHALAVPMPLHQHSYPTREARATYFETLRDKIASVPGVSEAAISTSNPPYDGYNLAFEILGLPFANRQYLRADFISPEYFSALHIPLLQGRLWNQSENQRGAPVVIINETLARRYFPHGDAVGQQIRTSTLSIGIGDRGQVVGTSDAGDWVQVIGVVGDSLNDGLDRPVLPALYIPYSRYMWEFTQFLIRTQGAPLTALHSIQSAIASVNSDQQTGPEIHDLQGWIESAPEYQQQRLFSILFALFSSLALALALVGLYSVVSYSVAQRTNEFGIRMALGAQRTHVLWIVARNIGITVFSGLATGLILFLTLHKLLIHFTQSSSSSPLILAAVAALFILCAALSCTIPALRAASIDPIQALRYE